MSEMEHCVGKLTKVEKLENETLEQQCKRLLGNRELLTYYDSYQEMLVYEHDCYVIYNNYVYLVERRDIDPYDDFFDAYEDENGVIHFEVRFYNGGCGFVEAIERALKIKREDD